MALQTIQYTPPPTVRAFMLDYLPGRLFYDFVVGPYGSGKTTGLFFKLVYMAKMQEPWADGVRRSRCVIVRNTAPMLRDTTIVSWNYWFKAGEAGEWKATEKTFILKFDDVECEVMFRPLDTPDDVRRVLSLEVTFAILDEFVEIPRQIVEALSGRVGRYPAAKDGGATNYGMWGASNPSTEDNWWYDFLHKDLPSNVKYFHQPSGRSPEAENTENLRANYYKDLEIGKSLEWVKQFIDAEWGYSASGKPVVATFKPHLHLATKPLLYNPLLPLIFGLDPGFAGTAAIFGQEDLDGKLRVFGEVLAENMSIDRYIMERLRPYIRTHFPDATHIECAPDPAAANRAQTDARSVVDVVRKFFPAKPEANNAFSLRTNAIDNYTTRLVDGEPALQIDEKQCPVLVRALKGGWRWEVDDKKSVIKDVSPEKNQYSHPGDAFGYLCRYFHKRVEKNYRYSQGVGGRPFAPSRQIAGGGYHFR